MTGRNNFLVLPSETFGYQILCNCQVRVQLFLSYANFHMIHKVQD